MKLYQKFLAASLLAASALTTACQKEPRRISYEFNENTSVYGKPGKATLPCSGQTVNSITIQGSQLEEGQTYFFSEEKTRLVVEGNVPEEVTLRVDGGQLVINGDVGDHSSVSVSVPRVQVRVYDVCYLDKARKVPFLCYHHKDGAVKPPYDCDAPLVVKGTVGKGVQVSIPR